MKPAEAVQASCLDPRAPIDIATKVVVAECPACQRPLRMKARAITPAMRQPVRLTCSCQAATSVTFSSEQVAAVEKARPETRSSAGQAAQPAAAAPSVPFPERKSVATCGAHLCEQRVPLFARLRGWRKNDGMWFCPGHSDYSRARVLLEFEAAYKEVMSWQPAHPSDGRAAPAAGWEERLGREHEEIVRKRPAFIAREENELGELTKLCNRNEEKQVLDRLRMIGRQSTARLCDFTLADGEQRFVAAYAVDVLAGIDEAVARDTIVRSCGHEERVVRAGAAGALGNLRDDRRLGILLTLLRDEWFGVRRRSAESLGRVGDVRALGPLVTALDDADGFVRLCAAQAMAELGDARGLAFLRAAAASDDPLVREESRSRLVALEQGGTVALSEIAASASASDSTASLPEEPREAASNGDEEPGERLLAGGHIERQALGTALLAAAAEGHADVVRLLLERGANPNSVDEKGSETALTSAVVGGNAEVVRMLLAAGADLNRRRGFDNGTPLGVADWLGKSEIFRILRDAGASRG